MLCLSSKGSSMVEIMERGTSSTSSIWRSNLEISPSCPRCGSSNTKFCYYNNYSLTQPRYFCKGCRRYWTKGGSLRNVPVGGGCRKTRRPKCSSSASSSSGKNPTGGSYDNNNGRMESCGSASAGPNIDLAAVYANFLNPNPNKNSKDESPSRSDLDSFGSGLMIAVENPKDASLGPTWDSEINDHHYQHHHHHHRHPMLYVSHELNNAQKCNYGLPPLPGEELVAIDHGVWSDSLLIDNQTGTIPVQGVHEPVVHFGDESEDPTNLLFGNWSPFDFSADG